MIHEIVAGVLLSDAVALGGLAFFWRRRRQNRLENWNLMAGEVVEIKTYSGRNGPTRRPVIRYRTPQGKDEVFESKYGPVRKVEVGDQLEILVDPSDSARAEVVNSVMAWAPLALRMGALVSIAGAVVVWSLVKA